MTADPLAAFARAAEAFAGWASDGTDRGPDAARAAVRHLVRLYAAALDLPNAFSSDDTAATDVSQAEWRAVFDGLQRRLPFDQYAGVFWPTVVPPEPAIVYSLADDLADVYRDVEDGLRQWRAGQLRPIDWVFAFEMHWGHHAAGAIRALHEWMVVNAPERLSADPL